jgi:hypothetical protein
MHSTGVAAVTAFTAHREWATRPPDERFASVSTLYEAARDRRDRTEERVIETSQIHTDAPTDDGLVLREPSGQTGAHALELRAARRHRRCAAALPPHACRRRSHPVRSTSGCVGNAATGCSSSRTRPTHVDHTRRHLPEVRARAPRRAGRPGARPDGRASRLAPAARLQGRRVRR